MALTEQQIRDILLKSRLEVTHKFEVPPTCLEIVNEEEHESAIFGTFGNFSTLVAAPKVGKTTLVAIPVASYLTNKRIAGFEAKVPAGKEKVLWIDTEQGKNEAVNTLKAICSFAGLPHDKQPDNLIYFPFREYSHSLRVQLIDFLINHTSNLGLVVIDGIRDLINSINDEREATMINEKLLKWSEQKQIHIVTILHQNKGDGNARGHLGTELMNKAETVITLSKDVKSGERQTVIEAKHTRHQDFKNFAIVLRNNQPQLVGVTEYLPTNPKVNQLSGYQKNEIVKAVFETDTFLSYSKLWQTIKTKLKDVCSIEFGDNKCKDLAKSLVNENFVLYNEETKHYQKNV